ncbi:MAG: SpoIID/LytB domain-containing protein [Bacteroidia bacterium]
MFRAFTVFVFVIFTSFAFSQQELKISLYHGLSVKHAQINNDLGEYILLKDDQVDTLVNPFSIKVLKNGYKVSLNLNGEAIGDYKTVSIKRLNYDSGFKIKSLTHSSKERKYWGDLVITSNGKYLNIINQVLLPQYIEGVVESESGSGQSIEYYKIQATISRTYALSHFTRHQSEGFNLCDQVHCQVYHHRSLYNEFIPQAVVETKNMVLVDADINLITAAFHSNCGGQTVNSEDVWTQQLSYLRSVKDPFCTDQSQATWTKEIDKEKFIAYIKTKNAPSLRENILDSTSFNFFQDVRKIYYSGDGYRVPLRKMRDDWTFKSTFFSTEEIDGKIIVNGKGFGHGVGLCQEGAMKMAQLGYSFLEILRFYYTDVHLIDLEYINFYRAE